MFFARAYAQQIIPIENSVKMPVCPMNLNPVTAHHRNVADGFQFCYSISNRFGHFSWRTATLFPRLAFSAWASTAKVGKFVDAHVPILPSDLHQFVVDVNDDALWGHVRNLLSLRAERSKPLDISEVASSHKPLLAMTDGITCSSSLQGDHNTRRLDISSTEVKWDGKCSVRA